MDSPGEYVYDSLLSDRAIRLIQIQPNPTALNGFSVKLRTYEIDDRPSFCALSYTWDSAIIPDEEDVAGDGHTTPIDCEGQTMLAADNLLHFLCHARDQGWFTEEGSIDGSFKEMAVGDEETSLPRFVWIDAISINQKDTGEHSRQVSLMGQIYRTSSLVLVWFGKDNPPSGAERVLRTFIPAFLALKRAGGFKLLRGKDPWCGDAEVETRLGADACAVWRQDWTDLFMFLVRCRWLRRGWVVQEVGLKALDDPLAITIVCGSLQMPWVDLYEFLAGMTTVDWRRQLTARLRQHPVACRRSSLYSGMLQRALAVWNICIHDLRDCVAGNTPLWLSQEFGEELTHNERAFCILFKILHAMRTQEFSDRRDTVYGFLGLLEAAMPPGSQEIVHPDYTLSDVEVLSHTTWRIISNMPYLDLLSAIQNVSVRLRNHSGADLPTWVPKFSPSLHSVRRTFRNTPFDASATRSPCSLFRLENGKGLTLIGRRVCHVEFGVRLYPNEMRSIRWERLLKELEKHRRGKYPGTEQLYDEAICRTLVVDTFHPNLKPRHYQSEFRSWWASVLAIRLRCLDEFGSDSPDYKLLLAGDGGSEQNWLPLQSDILERSEHAQNERLPKGLIQTVSHRVWATRSIFSTADGQLGLGPQSLQKDDEVWILQGGRTPFILRKEEEGNYSFVGDAYLHAAMYGQLATPEFNEGMGPVTIY